MICRLGCSIRPANVSSGLLESGEEEKSIWMAAHAILNPTVRPKRNACRVPLVEVQVWFRMVVNMKLHSFPFKRIVLCSSFR